MGTLNVNAIDWAAGAQLVAFENDPLEISGGLQKLNLFLVSH